MDRIDALKIITDIYEDSPIISTVGATSRELKHVVDRDNHLYVVDSMGFVSSVAVGLSMELEKSKIKKVVAVEGDGGILMNPNALSSASFLKPEKLVLMILDNGCFSSTGGQRTLAETVQIDKVAAGYGLSVRSASDEESLRNALDEVNSMEEPVLVHVKISPYDQPDMPYVYTDPAVLTHRFKTFIASHK